MYRYINNYEVLITVYLAKLTVHRLPPFRLRLGRAFGGLCGSDIRKILDWLVE